MYDTLESTLEIVAPRLRRHAAKLVGCYASNLEGMTPEAQDLVQGVTQIIIEKWVPGQTPAYWVNMSQWRMKDALRKDRVYVKRVACDTDLTIETEEEELNSLLEMIAADETSPEDRLISHEDGELARALIKTLRPEHVTMVSLLAHGYNLGEIAELSGVSRDTAWKRLSRIRDIFRTAGLAPAYAMVAA